jgi:hypothetical protein
MRTNAQVYRIQEDESTLHGSDPFPAHSLLRWRSVSTRHVPIPDNVDEVPNFTACTNNNKHAAAKILHAILLKMRNNAVFINTLLSLIPMEFKLLYEQEKMMNHNTVF